MIVFIEIKTKLCSSTIRTHPAWNGSSYSLYSEEGGYVLSLPQDVTQIKAGVILYEDDAVIVRT